VILELAAAFCLLTGSFFGVVGAIGLLRFPDFYTRLHAVGVTDTLCAALVLTGLMLQAATLAVVAKLMLVLIFLLFTSPTSTHALARAALRGEFRPPVTEDREAPG